MSQGTALVLGGGGAKGMYHIGAWQALREMDISIDAVIGNSVGALVAGFIAQGDFDLALQVVEDMDLGNVIAIPPEFLEKGQFNLNEKNLLKLSKFQKNILTDKGLDTTPLRELLNQSLNEEVIRTSGIDLGITTFQINKLKEREIFLDEMEEGELSNYLLASATVPGFKVTKIGEDSFIDGGVYNNIPIDMAINRGYKNIIVIDIAGLGITKKLEIENYTLTYIKNKSDLGGLLDFDKQAMQQLKDLGYRDTLRVFGELEGRRFYIRPEKEIPGKLLSLWEKNKAELIPEDIWTDKENKNLDQVIQNLYKKLPKEYKYLKNRILLLAECAATTLNVDRDRIYSWNSFLLTISMEHKKVLQEVWTIMETLSEGPYTQRMKKALELTMDFHKYQKDEMYKYFLLSRDFRKAFPHIPALELENNYSEINPARIFLNLMEEFQHPLEAEDPPI